MKKIIIDAIRRFGVAVILKAIAEHLEDSKNPKERTLSEDLKAAVKKFEKE